MPTYVLMLVSGVGDIILSSGKVGALILVMLSILSIISWSITADKLLALRKSTKATRRFLKLLPGDFSIFEAAHYTHGLRRSSLAQLFSQAAASVEKDLSNLQSVKEAQVPMIAQSARVAMERASLDILDQMEGRLIFLATTASASPFIGLLGTVWGVMESFLNMGRMGAASLSVVGPGVAVALITTIFGLAAAIPALVAYNYFLNAVRRETSQMESFVSLVSDSVEKEIRSEIQSSKIPV